MVKHSQATTIRDVARQARVSAATVSRYLNRSAPVAAETGQRIQQAMRELGYSPRLAARALASRKTYTVGFISSAINYAFFGPLLGGIESTLLEKDYRLLIATSALGDGKVPLGPHNTDGVIVFANALSEEQLAEWYAGQFPCVLVYSTAPKGLSIPSVGIENKESSRLLVEHLIQVHGKRRIAFVSSSEYDYQEDIRRREAGYRAALARHGLAGERSLIFDGGYSRSKISRSLEARLLEALPAIDAIFAADDDLALSVIGTLHKAGIRVPQDVAVVGFDDQHFAALLVPPLTTVRASSEQVGRVAAQQLLGLLRGENVAPQVLLPTEIVIRESCGCGV